MKIRLEDLLNVNSTLKEIINNGKTVDSLFKFKLLGMMKAMEGHVANFETIRNEKIVEYGRETGDGSFQIDREDKETVDKFKKSLEEILDSLVHVDVEGLKPSEVFNKGVDAEYLIGLYPVIRE